MPTFQGFEKMLEKRDHPCTSIVLFFVFFLSVAASALAEGQNAGSEEILISAIENEQTHAIAKHVLMEAYSRLGYKVVFDDLPGRRALEWANTGLTDGDVARIAGTGTKYPNLIRVETPVIYFKGVAFSKTIDKPVNTWDDLKGLRIGVVRGIRYSTIGTKGMDPFFANDMTHLYQGQPCFQRHPGFLIRGACFETLLGIHPPGGCGADAACCRAKTQGRRKSHRF